MLTYADVCLRMLTYEFWRVINDKGISNETLRKVKRPTNACNENYECL